MKPQQMPRHFFIVNAQNQAASFVLCTRKNDFDRIVKISGFAKKLQLPRSRAFKKSQIGSSFGQRHIPKSFFRQKHFHHLEDLSQICPRKKCTIFPTITFATKIFFARRREIFSHQNVRFVRRFVHDRHRKIIGCDDFCKFFREAKLVVQFF